MHLAHTAHRALTQTPWCYTQARYNSDLRNVSPEGPGSFVLEHFSLDSIVQVHLTEGRKVQKGVRHPEETPQTAKLLNSDIVCAHHNQGRPDRKEKNIKCTLSVMIKNYTFISSLFVCFATNSSVANQLTLPLQPIEHQWQHWSWSSRKPNGHKRTGNKPKVNAHTAAKPYHTCRPQDDMKLKEIQKSFRKDYKLLLCSLCLWHL